MNANTKAIYELCRVIKEQQELLRLALWVMSQGPTVFRGQEIKCVLKWDQVRAASATCLGAGQSLNTILKAQRSEAYLFAICTQLRGVWLKVLSMQLSL